jgi:hypothetical protein
MILLALPGPEIIGSFVAMEAAEMADGQHNPASIHLLGTITCSSQRLC